MKTMLPARISHRLRSLAGRDPVGSLLREMDDLIERFSLDWESGFPEGMTVPSVDLAETADSVEIRMDLPGVKPEQIDIQISGDLLTITGERSEEKEEKGKTFHRTERRYGSFSRSLTLPCAVNEEKVSAECHDGVLTVKLTKTEQAKTHKIRVKGATH